MGISQFPQKSGIPSGNTAGRPSGAVTGDTYYNGTIGILEIYDGTNWIPCSAPPSVPTISVANVGTNVAYGAAQASVTFTPGTVGGKITGYTASSTTGGYIATSTSNPVIATVGNNGSYTFTGTTYNDFGTSVASPSATATLTTVPQAPTIGAASAGNANASVTFTGNANGGSSITSYTVTSSPGNITATGSSSPITVTGLTNDTAYTFTVKANNANGASLASAATNSVTPSSTVTVDYLVVAGGASGGGAGGGAGGLRSTVTATGRGGTLESPLVLNLSTNYTVTVGGGGALYASGNNSVFSTITSIGGGATTANGGCGGGGGVAATPNNGTGTTGQGYDGGRGGIGTGQGIGGGGGGTGAAGGVGAIGTGNTGGAGGNGVAVSITGTSVTYGGGGGAGGNFQYQQNAGGPGGTGGGGNGACINGSTSNGVAGTANTGGGGGGAGYNGAGRPAGVGGSGVVILRYPSASTITIGAGLTGTTATSGSNKVTTITAGSGNVSWA